MKRAMLCTVIVAAGTLLAGAQTLTAPKSNWLADSVTRTGDVTQLRGHVRIASCSIVTADEAVSRGDIDVTLSGNVHMRLTNGVDPLAVER
jgi:hypothetical protein